MRRCEGSGAREPHRMRSGEHNSCQNGENGHVERAREPHGYAGSVVSAFLGATAFSEQNFDFKPFCQSELGAGKRFFKRCYKHIGTLKRDNGAVLREVSFVGVTAFTNQFHEVLQHRMAWLRHSETVVTGATAFTREQYTRVRAFFVRPESAGSCLEQTKKNLYARSLYRKMLLHLLQVLRIAAVEPFLGVTLL